MDSQTQDTTDQPTKTLRRSTSDRMLGGVCAGFADYTGIDANLIRVLVVVMTLFSGLGIVLYAAGWLLIPAEDSSTNEAERIYQDFRGRTQG